MIPKIVDFAQRIQSHLLWKSHFVSISLILCVSFACNATDLPQIWNSEKVQTDIRLFSADSPSGYQWVKAQVETSGNIEQFLALLDDVDRASMWIENVEHVTIVARPNPNQRLVRTTFSAPWPVKDRDMATFSEIEEIKDHELIITISDGTSAIPVDRDYVRIEQVKGQWHLVELAPNRIKITYIGYGEPSGNMPVWLANTMVMSSTFKTFSNLRRMMNTDE